MRADHVKDRLDLLLASLEARDQTGKVRVALQILVASGMLGTLNGAEDRIKKAHGKLILLGNLPTNASRCSRLNSAQPTVIYGTAGAIKCLLRVSV